MKDRLITAYTKEGKGNNVLFLHGWGCDKSIFRRLSQTLLRLCADREMCTVAIDFWGFGESGVPQSELGVADYAEKTADFIVENCAYPLTVIGHSFGGRVAVVMASKYPHLIDRVVIIGGAGLRRFSLKRAARIFKYKILKLFAKFKLIDKTSLDNMGSADYKAANGVMKKIFIRVVNEDLSRYAKEINCPVLLIYGERDTDTPLWIAKKYKRLIKRSSLKIIHRAGHYVFIEREYDTAKIITDFLGV